ncbi:hypothetical protein CLFO_30140 [Clostridium formicaceticum]|uniref:Uncharacterized protein n=1 Tax=Clostridium formicaceticum TaxID=1497 RepID=A0AAC9RNV4_9CLOT|nr:hypothetical protein CLFO_30140 [Clostridium formicaceticum]
MFHKVQWIVLGVIGIFLASQAIDFLKFPFDKKGFLKNMSNIIIEL